MNNSKRALDVAFVALTTSKTLNILIKQNRKPTEKELRILHQGSDLLQKLIAGSLVVEGKTSTDHLISDLDSIAGINYAISTISHLRESTDTESVTDLIEKLDQTLTQIIREQLSPDTTESRLLVDFFTQLSSNIAGKLANPPERLDRRRELATLPDEKRFFYASY